MFFPTGAWGDLGEVGVLRLHVRFLPPSPSILLPGFGPIQQAHPPSPHITSLSSSGLSQQLELPRGLWSPRPELLLVLSCFRRLLPGL